MARVVLEGPCFYSREESACPDVGVLPKNSTVEKELPRCKYTFIDRSGKVISPERYDYAFSFAEGQAPVRVGDRWGYIDKNGTIVIPPRFDSASLFSDGRGLVSGNKLFGYIDRTGEYVITPQFDHAETFSEGRAVVRNRISGGYYYIDREGRNAFPGTFDLASPFFKGLAHVLLPSDNSANSGRAAYINPSGAIVFAYGR
jgi:hypothetical protein